MPTLTLQSSRGQSRRDLFSDFYTYTTHTPAPHPQDLPTVVSERTLSVLLLTINFQVNSSEIFYYLVLQLIDYPDSPCPRFRSFTPSLCPTNLCFGSVLRGTLQILLQDRCRIRIQLLGSTCSGKRLVMISDPLRYTKLSFPCYNYSGRLVSGTRLSWAQNHLSMLNHQSLVITVH